MSIIFSIPTLTSLFPRGWGMGVQFGGTYTLLLPPRASDSWNELPLVSQSCIKLFLICPTANVTTSKAVMTSRYGNHTFTSGPSLSVCMSSEMSLRILNTFSYRGQGNPGLKYLHMTDDLDILIRSHSPVKLNSNIKHTTLLIFTSRHAEPH